MHHAFHLSTRTRISCIAIATVVLAVATAGPAPADPPSFDLGTPFPTVGNFHSVTLNGTDQLTSATIAPFTITDASGALAGWHVTMLVPALQNGTGADCAVGATASLAGGNLSMAAPIVTPADGLASMTGVTSSGYSDFTAPRTIISAAAGDGAGSYDVAPEILKLLIPANTLPGDYCTQATIAITSGP